MGWTTPYDTHTKQQVVDLLNSQRHWGEHYRVLESSVRGNHHWQLVELLPTHPSFDTLTSPFIALNLLGYDRGVGCWGYKDICESMGPCEVDCPIKYLDRAPVAGQYGEEWRSRVRAHHEAMRTRAKLEPGMEIELNHRRFVLKENRGRRGWYIRQVDTGETFRASCRTVRHGRVVSGERAAPAQSSNARSHA